MSNRSIGLSEELHAYLLRVGVREAPILARLREETAALPQHDMQIAPEQGAFMALVVELLDARRCIELGTFTGYSSLAVALALPPEGRLVCCDISEEWTGIARRYWAEAGVAERIELRLGPARETLDRLLAAGQAGSFDLAFVDADKRSYPAYHERLLELLRPGGLILYDNVFWGGEVISEEVDNEDVRGIRTLNERLATDERVSLSMIPLADGLTLARKR
ncbi:MAG TPA: class I SAM-dependent methyltransferase [Candidatus Limnocylindrales bacterium]|nr:class I SAM-dependent methyltransferase [Candidatus Limnocylindrales bacterium]